jgi:hypothetical protein
MPILHRERPHSKNRSNMMGISKIKKMVGVSLNLIYASDEE